MTKTKTRPRRKARNDNPERPKTVYDPQHQGGIVFRGDEQPTPEMLARLIEALDFSDLSGLPLPLQKINTAPREHAYRKRDNLDLLHQKGTLDDAQLIIARKVQEEYDIANDIRIASICAERVGNGRVDTEAIADRRMRASRRYVRMMGWVGGMNTMPGLTVLWFVCRRRSFRWLSDTYAQKPENFSVILCASLEIMAQRAFQGISKKSLTVSRPTG